MRLTRQSNLCASRGADSHAGITQRNQRWRREQRRRWLGCLPVGRRLVRGPRSGPPAPGRPPARGRGL